MADLVIASFNQDFRFLSNFWAGPVPVLYRGSWPTAEHAYQAAKSYDPVHVERVRQATTPGEAKRAGRSAVLVPHWETTRVLVMWQVLIAKFGGGDYGLWARLKETEGYTLVEGNTWHDQFWGSCTCPQRSCQPPGENWLGRLLMVVRDANPAGLGTLG